MRTAIMQPYFLPYLGYFQLISAVLLGWAIFGDLPGVYVIAGMALIIAAGSASAVFQSRRPVATGP